MKLIFTILLAALSFAAHSQVSKVELSEPVDLPKFGWSKVLMMKNGNTVLFHFEQRKSLLVKVFGKDRKEIASQRHTTKLLNVNNLDQAILEGVADINGEAVLFYTQEIENKTTLARVRFDANSAGLIAEDKIVQSESFQKKTETKVLIDPDGNGYSVFCFKDPDVNPKLEIRLEKYDAAHNLVKQFPFQVAEGDHDYVKVVGIGVDHKGGIQVTVLYSKIVKFPDLIDREIVVYYLAPSAEQVVAKQAKLPQGFYPAITEYTYNAFSGNLNLLMKSTLVKDIKNIDYSKLKQIFYPPVMLVVKDDMSTMSTALLSHERANARFKSLTDTSRSFEGEITSMYTNERGLTTMVTENFNWEKGLAGHLALTQYNDDGGELWATMIGKAHYNQEEKGPFVFGHEMNMELHQYKVLYTKNSTYVLFNDLDKNFGDTALKVEPVYRYGYTNSIFHKLDRKRQLSKGYLLNNPLADESKAVYIGSSDFDRESNIYSSVIMHREGKKNSYKIAWCYLEP